MNKKSSSMLQKQAKYEYEQIMNKLKRNKENP